MTREISLAGSRGAAGIVTGALNPDGTVNIEHTRVLGKGCGAIARDIPPRV